MIPEVWNSITGSRTIPDCCLATYDAFSYVMYGRLYVPR